MSTEIVDFDPQPGHELGIFVLVKLLGEGGMGKVFLAEDRRIRRKVALKVMRPDVARLPSARERFLREARLMATLENDFIVRLYHVDEDRGIPYFAMELLRGETLSDYLARDPIPPIEFTIRVGVEVSRGLSYAHKQGLIHRDIKPANIWLESLPDGGTRCKILDFGLAREIQPSATSVTQGEMLGTPSYMSPEQWRGGRIDGRSDWFSLGVLLYRMATGMLPFEGESLPQLMFQMVMEHPRSPEAANPKLPNSFCRLILRLLEKDPEARPAANDSVCESLSEIREISESSHLVDVESLPFADTINMPASQAAAVPEVLHVLPLPEKPKSHSRRGLWLAVGGIAAALIVTLFLSWSPPNPAKEGTGDSDVTQQTPSPLPALRQTQIELEQRLKQVRQTWDEKRPPITASPQSQDLTLRVDAVSELVQGIARKLTLLNEKIPDAVLQEQIAQSQKDITRQLDELTPAIAAIVPSEKGPRLQEPARLDFVERPGDAPELTRSQAEWARYLGVPVEWKLNLGTGVEMEFCLIPPGRYRMGSSRQELEQLQDRFKEHLREIPEDEMPDHVVLITRPFYLSRFETRRADYAAFIADTQHSGTKGSKGARGWNPSKKELEFSADFGWKKTGWAAAENHPVVNVSWNDALAFNRWLGTRMTPRPRGFEGFRLPSEAEWEYVYRAGSNTSFPSGSEIDSLTKRGNLADVTLKQSFPTWSKESDSGTDGFDFTAPVGKFPANGWGLHDLGGNVSEWCADGYRDDAFAHHAAENPLIEPRDLSRVYRGASWALGPTKCRCSFRQQLGAATVSESVGFRVVLQFSP